MNQSIRCIKFLIIILFVINGANSFGQYHKGLVINNNGDSINCEIFLPKYLNGQFNYSTLTKRITALMKDGGIQVFKPEDIVKAEIQVEGSEKLRFVSIPEDKKQFFQERVNGKLSLFTLHFTNSGFPAPILRKNSKLTYLNVVNKKKRVTELIADFPELYSEWQSEKYDFNNLDKVVELYNRNLGLKN